MIPRTLGVHDGAFHADEVTASALLLLADCIDEEQIIRTRDLERLKNCEYVCDVGGVYAPEIKRFDHHQCEYRGELSSAGMVCLYLRDKGFLSEEEYSHLRRDLIIGVDDHDNGRVQELLGHCSFSHVIASFNPLQRDVQSSDRDSAFLEAVAFVKSYLKKSLDRFHYLCSSKALVIDAMEKGKKYLIFDQNVPWLENFFDLGGEDHPALFILMPASGQWKLRGIPPSYDKRMSVRLPFPEKWAGLMTKDLELCSGIPGAVFCHKGRFISVWETKKAALHAVEQILKRHDDYLSKNH